MKKINIKSHTQHEVNNVSKEKKIKNSTLFCQYSKEKKQMTKKRKIFHLKNRKNKEKKKEKKSVYKPVTLFYKCKKRKKKKPKNKKIEKVFHSDRKKMTKKYLHLNAIFCFVQFGQCN